ncbi:MAG TPA: hypothetical protein DEA08_21305 [Planctomycetes bacterium]|nr:hypothetical protein [Planctomycetota bacterium]
MSLARPQLGLLLGSALTLAACGGGPEPAPAPAPRQQDPAPPGPSEPSDPPTPAVSNGGGKQPAKSPTITLTSRRFGSEIRRFEVGDVIEVLRSDGRYARGRVEKLSPHELVLSDDSGRSEDRARLRPSQVTKLELLYRPVPTTPKTGGPAAPLNPEETWLERYAPDQILGQEPHVLWNSRFLHNVPLIVERTFSLTALTYVERSRARTYFRRGGVPQSLYRGDEVKLVGSTLGYHTARRGEQEPCLGWVYLYLVKRSSTVWPLYSLDRIHPGDLSKESVQRFLSHEPVTLVVRRPGQLHPHKVYRFKAERVRIYRKHLEATPEPAAIRRMRARRHDKLQHAEERVRNLYKAFGLREEGDLHRRLEVSFYLPAAVEGGLHLLRYRRVIGLD